MKDKIYIDFNGKSLELNFFKYNDGLIGILLIESDGSLHGPGTVNVSKANISSNEILLKNYSDNTNIYESFKTHKIVKNKKREISIGLNKALVCELEDWVLDYLNNK